MTDEQRDSSATKESLEEIVAQYVKRCELCKEPTKRRCSTCKWAYYCCKEHQEEDWESRRVNGGWRQGHEERCAEPSQLFKEAQLVYVVKRKYGSRVFGTRTYEGTIKGIMNHTAILLKRYATRQMAMIEWALQQTPLRPRNTQESALLFDAAIVNSRNGLGVSIARLLLRYNVTPESWAYYGCLEMTEAQWNTQPWSSVINIIHKANLRRVCMEIETAELGWRPWTQHRYARAYRYTMRTLVVIAKATTKTTKTTKTTANNTISNE